MSADAYVPTPGDKFSFGIWTVGWQGVDVFGGAVRPPMAADRAVRKLAELGAYGVNFHDNDVFGFDDSPGERDRAGGEPEQCWPAARVASVTPRYSCPPESDLNLVPVRR